MPIRPEDVPSCITKFYMHYHSIIEAVVSIPRAPHSGILKKSCYVMVIDSIARIVFPELRKRSGARFRRAILDFANWPHASYFSLPYLHRYLKVSDDNYFAGLRSNLVNPAYEVWLDELRSLRELPWINVGTAGQVLSVDADLPEAKVLALLGTNDKKNVGIRKFQHCSLLYDYRSFLLHSLSTPGIADRPEVVNYPYYEQYIAVDTETNQLSVVHYDLVYSGEFFRTLANRVLGNASSYFIRQKIDPSPRMQASIAMYWDDELNKKVGPFEEAMISSLRRLRMP